MRHCLIMLALARILVTAVTCQAATLYGVTGNGGTPSATLHVINQTNATVTPVLPLNDNNGGQVIAYNPDDGYLYHWTGWPSTNTRMEKIDLETLAVTEVPLSGFATNEVQAATYDRQIGAFLVTDLSHNFTEVTADGFRTKIGSTARWVRGLTFVGDALYGGHNSLIPVNELWEIDPANGDFLSTMPVSLPGFTVASFAAQATNPDTGELWAVLLVLELPKKTRLLVKLDPHTGLATLVGVLPELSGFSSIAFVPDPVIAVEIDVKPGDAINAIHPGSRGVIPVAIFSREDFDATLIDPTTILLAGAEVAVVGKGNILSHVADINADGLDDLVCQVDTESLSLTVDFGEICLIGETYGGEKVRGCDVIVVVPSGD